MKRRAPPPALSSALAQTLALTALALAMSGCRIIPEGAGMPPSAPMQVPPSSYRPAPPDVPPPPARPLPPASMPEQATPPLAQPAGELPASHPYNGPPLAYTRIGETVSVDGPRVTPLSLIEDSRCPQGVQCIQAGRLRLRVRIDLGSGSHKIDMTLGQPVQVADGSLTLLAASPTPVAGSKPAPLAYQFGFRFMGGL